MGLASQSKANTNCQLNFLFLGGRGLSTGREASIYKDGMFVKSFEKNLLELPRYCFVGVA